MKHWFLFASIVVLAGSPVAAQVKLSSVELAAVFKAAGFKLQGGKWQACGDPGTASYTPGEIQEVRDLNGDGRPEAIVTEGSTFCYGSTEVGYTLVSKQADGKWKRIAARPGVATILKTKGVGGWPDIEVGGPGFCFPVERWNGSEYKLDRHQYEGKTCQPSR
jgi:hypothetical protein